ncbi:hypothetical protein QEJ81_02340 [Halomonas icarae]|uniref:Uncharacterized protein n=1 Tax=Halomonas icarae TaxID=2691040 RepID=A0A7X5AMA2_9GAMM|nr:hypothetical protein [Halomonas icarae]MDR5900942.1 hypothetical protein [Halomonas icarae]NAW13591.1 hypothetical protein [Halomonas icarae]
MIWGDKACGGDLWQHFRQSKRRSKHLAQAKSAVFRKILNRVGIENRTAELDDRLFISQWKGDTVTLRHKQSGPVRLEERRSGYLLAARLPNSAELTQAAVV